MLPQQPRLLVSPATRRSEQLASTGLPSLDRAALLHFQYLIKSTMSYKEALCRVAADWSADLSALSPYKASQAELRCSGG